MRRSAPVGVGSGEFEGVAAFRRNRDSQKELHPVSSIAKAWAQVPFTG